MITFIPIYVCIQRAKTLNVYIKNFIMQMATVHHAIMATSAR